MSDLTDDPTETLPKALSAEERTEIQVGTADRDVRFKALDLIDALTEHLAEAVARMTVAETEAESRKLVCPPCREGSSTRRQLAAALARAEAAERDKLSAEAQANDWKRSLNRAESEAAALRAQNERLRETATCGSRLATIEAANALLAAPSRTWTHEHWADWDKARAAHLAGQPAAPDLSRRFDPESGQ